MPYGKNWHRDSIAALQAAYGDYFGVTMRSSVSTGSHIYGTGYINLRKCQPHILIGDNSRSRGKSRSLGRYYDAAASIRRGLAYLHMLRIKMIYVHSSATDMCGNNKNFSSFGVCRPMQPAHR
jgi:hypothetical protein